jgi:uncharacterized protein YukE
MPPTDLFADATPPANLQPVQFDFGAAQSAATALREAADAVDRAARARTSQARDAERSWTGGQRRTFDTIESRLGTAASTLVRQLRRAADSLHDQAAAARAENARRSAALTHWRHDLATARRHYVEQQQQLARAR